MASKTRIINSFNGGLITPDLEAREDLPWFNKSCRVLKNWVVKPQGPVESRNGFMWVASTKDKTKLSRFIRFEFNENDSLQLEFGDLYIRFYYQGAQVLSGLVPYEIVSPYGQNDLEEINFVQYNDIMYLVHQNYRPQKLTRFALTNWTIVPMDNLYGPVLDRTAGQTITMQSTGTIGSVTITASSATFQAAHVGSVWGFQDNGGNLASYILWTDGEVIGTTGVLRRYNGNLYQNTTTGTTGDLPPTHLDGTVSDGGIDWKYVNSGYGFARMTGYTSSTQATFSVQKELPPGMIITPTTYWNEAAWSGIQGYPHSVSFWQQRLAFGGTNNSPLALDVSATNQRFESFDATLPEEDKAFRVIIAGQQNIIEWLLEVDNRLVGGTLGGVFFVGASNDGAVTPTNIFVKTSEAIKVSQIQAQKVASGFVFIHSSNMGIYYSTYNDLITNYDSMDLSLVPESFLEKGIKQIALQNDPKTIIWILLRDGELLGISFDPKEQIKAAHLHNTGVFMGVRDVIESISVIPSDKGDQLWAIIKRNVNGTTEKYAEYISPYRAEKIIGVDSAKVITVSAPTTSFTGIDHLKNREVQLVGDNNYLDTIFVGDDGSITTPVACKELIVGLKRECDLAPVCVASTKTKSSAKAIIQLYKTRGLKTGISFNDLQDVPWRAPTQPYDVSPTEFASNRMQNKEVQLKAIPTDNTKEEQEQYDDIVIRYDYPFKAQINGLEIKMDINETI